MFDIKEQENRRSKGVGMVAQYKKGKTSECRKGLECIKARKVEIEGDHDKCQTYKHKDVAEDKAEDKGAYRETTRNDAEGSRRGPMKLE